MNKKYIEPKITITPISVGKILAGSNPRVPIGEDKDEGDAKSFGASFYFDEEED